MLTLYSKLSSHLFKAYIPDDVTVEIDGDVSVLVESGLIQSVEYSVADLWIDLYNELLYKKFIVNGMLLEELHQCTQYSTTNNLMGWDRGQ